MKYYQDKLFYPSNTTSPSEKYLELWDSLSSSANAEILNSKRLFLIGDSLKLIALLSKSELIYLIKDILHQFYMWWKNTPAPFTHLNNMMISPSEDDLLKLSNFLTSLNQKKGFVIVLVNYPFNFKYDIKQLSESSLYNFFNNQSHPNLEILQSPLIINKKESVDWRNVHPNSTSMKEVFNFIKQEILNKNENTNPSSAKIKTSPAQ